MRDYRSLEHKYRQMIEDRNSELRKKIHNVARPGDPAPMSAVQKLTRHAEIKNKIIDEDIADKDDVDDKKKKNGPDTSKDSDTKEMDAKKLTGGKTEVDVKPTTNDKAEDSTKEDEKGKKAAKDENKKIGAKGVKEETMTTKNFGLSNALIQSVNEVLKGKHHKLDKNHNGKLDGQDFKMLRKEDKECGCKGNCKCSTNEEVEQVDEAQRTSSYLGTYKSPEEAKEKHGKNLRIRARLGKDNPNKKLYATGGPLKRNVSQDIKPEHGSRFDVYDRKKKTNEEVEQVDELTGIKTSPLKKLGYVMKAGKRMTQTAPHEIANNPDTARKFGNTLKTLKKMNKEEVEFSADELARIEEIAKGL